MQDGAQTILPNTPFEESLNQSNFGKFGNGLDALASTQNVAKTTAQMTPDELQSALIERNRTVDARAKAPSPYLPDVINASKVDTSGRFDRQLIGQDNEDLYGQMQSNWDKAANGILKTVQLATSTFLDGTLGSIYGLGQVITGHGLNSFYNNEFTNAIQTWNDKTENALPNYYTEKERDAKWYSPDNLFTANFLFDKLIKNAGFSLGAIAAGAATGAAIKGVTSLLPIFGAGEAANTVKGLEQALSSVPAESRWKVFQGIVRNAETNLGGKMGNFLAESVNSPTAQRFLISSLGAATEGGIEALQGLNEWRNGKIKEYTDKYGIAPTGDTLQKINANAEDLGNSRFGLNMALLTATNYIQLPKILGSSYKVSKGLANTAAAEAGDASVRVGQYSWLATAGAPSTALGKLAYRAKKIGGILFSPSEAFEETSQYAIQKGVESYYNKAYTGQGASMVDEMFAGYGKAFSDKEGLESLLLGGLSGGLQQEAGSSIDEKRLPFIGTPKSVGASKSFAAALNTSRLKLSSDKWLADMTAATARGINLIHEGEGYIRQGDVLEAKDNEHDQMHNYLAVRIKNGRYDLVKDDIAAIRNQAATDLASLKQQGIANEQDTQETFTKRLANFERHADNVNSLYSGISLRYGGLTDPKTKEKLYNEKVVDQMVYAASKASDYDQRIPELSSTLVSNGIPVGQVVNKIIQDGANSDVEVRAAVEAINNLTMKADGTSITSDERDDMKSNLRDVVEMALRRRAYLKEYDEVKNDPAKYGKPTEFKRKETAEVPTETGVQNVEIGRTYSYAAPIHREGNSIYLAPKLTPTNDSLNGELEAQMPNGQKQFIKKTDISKLGLTTTPNDNKDVDEAFMKAVGEVTDQTRFQDLKPTFTATPKTTKDLQTFVNATNNGEFTDAIMAKIAPKMADIQKAREEQIKKEMAIRKNKKLIDAIIAAGKLTGDGTNNDIVDDDSIGTKKDIAFIARTGTEQRFEDENTKYNQPHRRHQEFLLNFSRPATTNKFEKLTFQIIAVTAKTEEALGLKGIIDEDYKKDSIRYVYIARQGDNEYWNYVNKDGDLLGKTGEKSDPKQVIFTNAPEEDLSYNSGGKRVASYTNKPDLTQEQIADQLNEWKTQRNLFKSIATAEEAINARLDFSISRGLPNIAEITTQNNLLSIGLINEVDLSHPIIVVPTVGNTVIKGSEIEVNMPLGKPIYNYKGNLFFLNNRKFTNTEAKNILSLLQKALNNEDVDKILPFIKDVVYFTNHDAKDATGRNQIWFDKDLTMHTWNQTFTIEEVLNSDPKVIAAIEDTYHNVNNRSLQEFAKNPQNTPFNELSVVDGKLVTKVWPSYQHYLLSPRTGGTAPVTTNIIEPQADELPIIQKYPILHIGNLQEKEENIIPEEALQEPVRVTSLSDIKPIGERVAESVSKLDMSIVKPGVFKVSGIYTTLQGTTINITAVAQVKEGKATVGFAVGAKEVAALKENEQGALKGSISDRVVGNTPEVKEQAPVTDKKVGGFGKTGGFENTATRLTNKSFPFSGNKNKEMAEVQRMLPNLNIVMLQDMIRNTGGLKAWGYALPHFAYIWDFAPYGTLYHESFEQVFNWILEDDDRQALYNEFRGRSGEFTNFNNKKIKYSSATDLEIKEELADEFGQFKTTGKIVNPTAQKSSFFRKLIEFLKTLFTNPSKFWEMSGEVERVFKNIDNERYKNAPVLNDVNATPQYKRAVENMAESLVQDTIAGMTAELFMKKWDSDLSLIQELESNPEIATQTLFAQLKEGLEKYFTGREGQTLYTYFDTQAAAHPEKEQEYVQLYNDIQDNWDKVKGQWGNFMTDLKSFLRIFDAAFTIDDNGELSLADPNSDIEEKNPAQEYASEDKLFINAKNSASQAVKLLFATIADSKFVYQTVKNTITGNVEKIFKGNEFNREANQMRLNNLAPYAKLFNYTLHNAANTNGIYNIFDKLTTQSQKRQMKVNANLDVLLRRLKFDDGFNNLDLPTTKLLLKVENALTKQKPDFFTQSLQEGGNMYEMSSNTSDRASQVKEEWWDDMKGSKFIRKKGTDLTFKEDVVPADNNNFVFLSNLGVSFTKTQYDTLSKGNKDKFNNILVALKASVKEYITKKIPAVLTLNSTGFEGRLTELAKLYAENIEGDTTESQHFNVDNKPTSNFILNNYVSFIMNDVNNVSTQAEFLALNPQYNDLYMGNSYWLNNVLFQDGVRTDFNINVAILEGRVGSNRNATSSMTYGERILNEVNNNINGKYHILSADSKTEWGLRVNNVISRSFFRGQKDEQIAAFMDKMFNSLLNEIALAQDYDNRSYINSLNKKEGDREVGKSLRFFKTIFPKELIDRINEKIDSGEGFTEDQAANLKQLVSPYIIQYVQNRAQATITNLKSYQILTQQRNGKFKLYGIDSRFLQGEFGKKKRSQLFEPETVDDIFFYREANYIFANIEMHKFLFNDPAQYKDELKRVKSFMSGREFTHVAPNDSRSLNAALDKHLNLGLLPTDFGYHVHSNTYNALTIRDVSIHSTEEIVAKYKNYAKVDIADAQSWMSHTTYRELLYKAGGRFTFQQDTLHNWLMAYERQAYLKKGRINNENYSETLQAADKLLLKSPIPEVTMDVLKPIISGVRDSEGYAEQYLYKTSTAPLYYYFVEDSPMEDVLWNMEQNGVHFLAMQSAHKVGQQDANIADLFDEDFGNPVKVPVDFKYTGIQVDTSGKKDAQTQGSQLTKLAVQNLMRDGKPVQPEFAPLVKKHNDILANLAIKRAGKVFRKLGIKKGEFGYTYEDKQFVANFVLNELTRRELPYNIGEGVGTNEDGEFNTPLEANVNYRKIKEILWSTIENNITRPKTSGKPLIMMSSLGYDNLKKVEINGKEVLTSSKLKFYTQKDGKTQACQIAIPFQFGNTVLAKIEKAQGRKFANPKEGYKAVLDHLNKTAEGRQLLHGIGFRIPTQGLNSVDYFEVAQFLPPQMGDVVIFPAEITTKAGSDFDIDKMNMYLKNWTIGKNGYPVLTQFQDIDTNDEQALRDYYEANYLEDYKKYKEKEKQSALLGDTSNLLNQIFDVAQDVDGVSENEYVPDVEEFILETKGKSVYQVNSVKAVENEYYRTLEELLSLPYNFDRMIKPNDASQLKGISEDIQDLNGTREPEVSTNYTQLVDSTYMSKKRQTFLSMKSAVSIAAVSNTNLSINQMAGYNIHVPSSLAYKNFAIRFDFNENNGGISLSEDKNKWGDFLSDLNSQVIDGTVDATKSDWLAKMITDESALNILLFMYKAGINPKTTAFYLNQPAIQEFLKERGIIRNIAGLNTSIQRKSGLDVQREVNKKYGLRGYVREQKMRARKPIIYEMDDMTAMIGKQSTEMSQKQKNLQTQMLDDFLVFDRLAWDLFASIQGYNWDTTRFTSPEAVVKKKLQWQKAIIQTNTTSVEKLLNASHIGVLKDNIIDLNAALSGLINTQSGDTKRVLNEMAITLTGLGLTKDNFIKYLQRAEGSLIDHISQTQADFNGIQLNELTKYFFQGQQNIARWVRALKTAHPFNNFLNNIEAVEDPLGQLSYLKMTEQDYDTYTSNVWTASLREIRDSGTAVSLTITKDNKSEKITKTAHDIYNYILVSQILQNGVTRNRNSFLHLIPNEDYSNLISPHLRSIQGEEEWLQNDMYFRNNWTDDVLVPETQKDIVSEDAEGNVNYFPANYITNGSFYTHLQQNGHKGGFITLPTFTWKGKPFVKYTMLLKDQNGRVISTETNLYKRVDIVNETGGKSPITVKMPVIGSQVEGEEVQRTKVGDFVIYKQVNKLGDTNLKEYYTDQPYSILSKNPQILEVPDEVVIDALREGNYTVEEAFISNLINDSDFDSGDDENDDSMEFEDLPTPPPTPTPIAELPAPTKELPAPIQAPLPVTKLTEETRQNGRIRVEYPDEIQGIPTHKLQEFQNLPMAGKNLTDKSEDNDQYGDAVYTYLQDYKEEIDKSAAEWLRDNPEIADELLNLFDKDDYYYKDSGDIEDYAGILLERSEKEVDTAQLPLFSQDALMKTLKDKGIIKRDC